MSTETIWASPEAVRAAIHEGRAHERANQKAFDPKSPTHRETLLALTSEELTKLIPSTSSGGRSSYRIVMVLNEIATGLGQSGKFEDALRLFDAATTVPWHFDATLYCNALWAVQNDNHHLGVMPERARTYIARAKPHGPRNPAIFHNLVCVFFELGEHEHAIEATRDAVRFGYVNLAALRDEPLLAPLREDPRFVAAFDDPELLAAQQELVLPKALARLRATEGRWDEMDFELYETIEPLDETRAWLTAWTGNAAPPFVDDLRVFGQDGTGGKVAFLRTDRTRKIVDEPIVFFGSEGALGVVARDLADFFVLFAANLGPMEKVEHAPDDPPEVSRPLPHVKAVLDEHFPAAASRSLKQVYADAATTAPEFVSTVRAACG